MKKRLLSLISICSILIGLIPSYAQEISSDTLITVTQSPEKYIYFYHNDHSDTGGAKRMLVDRGSAYSAYSTYGFLAYTLENAEAITNIDFSVYCDMFYDNISTRTGNTFYAQAREDIPDIAKGTYAEDSVEYTEWKSYFNTYSDKTQMWVFNANSYPDVVFRDYYNSQGVLQNDKLYSGWLTRSLSNSILNNVKSKIKDDSSSILSIWAMKNKSNVTPDFKISKIKVTYDVSKIVNKSAENIITLVNSVENSGEMYACINHFYDAIGVNKNALSDISGVCKKLSDEVLSGTVYTGETFVAAYESACADYLIEDSEGNSIDITALTTEDFKSEFAEFDGTNDEFLRLVTLYSHCTGISSEYINDFSLLEETEKSAFITKFCSGMSDAEDINELFYRCLAQNYSGSGYEDTVKFSTDFSSDWKFLKYFLNQLDLSADNMTDIKALYDSGNYEAAVKAYRNSVLDEMRITDLGEFTGDYHETAYISRSWATFFVGINNSFSAYDVLKNHNLHGSPYHTITPDWSYSVKFPTRAQTTDISYFTCFNTIIAKYFETRDIIYLDKWMQIANVFCTEHRRWYNENYGTADYSTNLCWNYKNAQSTLNQVDRTLNIVKALAAFAKLADSNDAPDLWADVLEKREVISDKSLYDIIDPVMFANIAMSLMYDHSEALVLRYEKSGATPNQRFGGLKALAAVDRFFGDGKKYINEYTQSTSNGLIDYSEGSFYPDGGMIEQAFNYNNGELNSIDELYNIFESSGEKIPDYINVISSHAENARKLHQGIVFPNGGTPAVGMGGLPAKFSERPYTSIAFPYIGFYSMRSSWDKDGTNLFMQTPRRTSGHLYPSNNGIELYAKGRMLLMNGGPPWYAENMAPSDQVDEYDEYNAYFGESSSYNRNTVIINNKSQSKSEFNNAVGTTRTFDYTLDNLWHTSDSFDYLSSDYDGGYGSDKASAVHTRQIVYIKSLDMFVTADTVVNDDEEINECSQIWNFVPYINDTNNNVHVNGFSEDEVTYDSTKRFIKTADSDGSNVFLYNFYPENLEYTKYYGYKGEEGYRGFYANGFARRYPKVDMHVSWEEKGKGIPVLTLIEASDNTSSKITSVEDLSYADTSGGYSGFKLISENETVLCYFAANTESFSVGDAVINAKAVVYQKNANKLIAVGAQGYSSENFEGYIENGEVKVLYEIGIPSGFSWSEENTPVYSYVNTVPSVSDVKIEGNPYFGGTLEVMYDYNGEGTDKSMIQWYRSTDCKTWNIISGEHKKQYTIPRYNTKSVMYYYKAAVKPKSSKELEGKIVYSEPTTLCGNFFDDFENETTGDIYSYGAYTDAGKNFKVTVGTVTEAENTFLRLSYSGIGKANQKSNPFIRRYWKTADGLVSYQMRIRLHGDDCVASFSFADVTLASMTGKSRKQDEWYTVKCIINPSKYEIEGVPAMSWYYAYKTDSESEWTTSKILYFAEDKYDKVAANGNDNRFYLDLGRATAESEQYIDIDDYALLPLVSVEDISRKTEFNTESDEISYTLTLKNNDPVNERSRDVAVCAYENDKLVGVKIEKVTLQPNEDKTVNVTVSAAKQTADRMVKCLILESCDTLRPIYTHLKGFDYY